MRAHKFTIYFGMILLLIVIFAVFQDYGISTDEDRRSEYGKAIYNYFATGFADETAQNMGYASYYGGAADLLGEVVTRLFPFSPHESRHLLWALFGFCGICGVYKLATIFISDQQIRPCAGIFAALIIILTPGYFGSIFINPKDIPFATCYIWSLYLYLKLLQALPEIKPKAVILFGLVTGLALGIRVVGAFLILPYVLGVLFWCFTLETKVRQKYGLSSVLIHVLLYLILPAVTVAYLTMIFAWPWAHSAPLTNPITALMEFSDYTAWKKTTLLDGEFYAADQIPRYYLLQYLLIQLPELFLAASMTGLIQGLILLYRKEYKSMSLIAVIVAVIAGFGPVIISLIKGSTIYSGYRQFIFSVLILAALSGASSAYFIFKLKQTGKMFLYRVTLLSVTVLALQVGIKIIKLHPYQYSYYNNFVGGIAGAYRRFELDYWALSYREAAQGILAHMPQHLSGASKINVLVCDSRHSIIPFLDERFAIVKKPNHAHFVVRRHRKNCPMNRKWQLIHRTVREGVPLSEVYLTSLGQQIITQ
ncbi:glycosyltransferase family 39 protein [bacterium]|nr:glycosyltransferase family 39 protein [bacterium]